MFSRLYHSVQRSMQLLRDRQRDDYLASSTDLADLELRMRKLDSDDLDRSVASDGSDRRNH